MDSKTQQSFKVPVLSKNDLIDQLVGDIEAVGVDSLSPNFLGLPELKGDCELKKFVREDLWFKKDGEKRKIKLIPQMGELVCDIFFERVNAAIIWKNRGGGGSLCAAIIIFLCMIYKRKSFVDMAGSGEQAKNVYEYTKDFWGVNDKLPRALKDEPLQSKTELQNGVRLKCITTSDKQARGKHPPGLVADESCQEDKSADRIFETAIQMVFSEPDFIILLMSTFHVPVCLFQDYWDNAEEKGLKRYRWSCYDTMEKCTEPIDCRGCELTEKFPITNAAGDVVDWKYEGCYGKARNSDGFIPRKNVLATKRLVKSETFSTEHECHRPRTKGLVYPIQYTERAFADSVKTIKDSKASVGIDWGLDPGQTVVLPAMRFERFIGTPECKFFHGRPTKDIIKYLRYLKTRIGEFIVYADASHPFNNLDLHNAGFTLEAIAFNKWKPFGIDNLTKHFEMGTYKIDLSLVQLKKQFQGYRKDEFGRPIKKDDHGPDATMLAMLHFPFMTEFELDAEGRIIWDKPDKDEIMVF